MNGGEQKRVPIGRALRHEFRADDGRRRRPRIRDHLLLPPLGQLWTDDARLSVGTAARRERDDQAYQLAWKGLRQDGVSGHQQCCRDDRYPKKQRTHGSSPLATRLSCCFLNRDATLKCDLDNCFSAPESQCRQ